MTPEQFVYWLQGYFELRDSTEPLSGQMQVIHDHLKEVFEKRTPQRDLIGHDPYVPTPHVTPLETTPNHTGTPQWLDPNRPTVIC